MTALAVRLAHRSATFIITWFLIVAAAFAQSGPDIPRVTTHDNLRASGELANGVLTLRLEIREASWSPDSDAGPSLPVLAFAEEGKSPTIPGPLIRVSQGTSLH